MPIELEVEKSDEIEKILEGEFEERFQAFQRKVAEYASNKFIEMITENISKDTEWKKQYIDSFEMKEFDDLEPFQEGFAITASMSDDLQNIDAGRTLFLFRKVEGMTGVARLSSLMNQYNPWTMETIPPIEGGSGYAMPTVIRRVTKSEVEEISGKKKSDNTPTSVADQIEEMGYSVDWNISPKIEGELYWDIPWMALRAEFGAGFLAPDMHWRNTISKFKRSIIKDIENSAKIQEAFESYLLNPESDNWKDAMEEVGDEVGENIVERTREMFSKMM